MDRHKLFTSIFAVSAGVLGCRKDSYIGPRDSSAVGTYQLAFCDHSCELTDSAAAVIQGFLVLDSVRIAVPDSQAEYFAYTNASKDTQLHSDHPQAGCFALDEPGRQQSTLSGLPIVHNAFYAVALSNWRYMPDSTGLLFELYTSIDASFEVDAQLSGGRLVGIASAGGMMKGADSGITYVVGKKIGGPQPVRCFVAAPAHWTFQYQKRARK